MVLGRANSSWEKQDTTCTFAPIGVAPVVAPVAVEHAVVSVAGAPVAGAPVAVARIMPDGRRVLVLVRVSCVGGLDVSDDALMEQIMSELDLDA
jgi:hypothetical protein